MGRKTTVETFYATNKWNLSLENLNIGKKEKLKKETDSLPIAAQNNTIRTIYVKAKIDKTTK